MIRAIPQPLVSPLVASLVASPSGISGFAFPGETLTMGSGATSYQWFVNSDNRGTAQTLVLTVDDIGKTVTGIRNGITLPTVTVWHPNTITSVARLWTARHNVLTSISPDVAATNGQAVRRWNGIIAGTQADQATGGLQPIFRSSGLGGVQTVNFDGSDDTMTLPTPSDVLQNKSQAFLIAGVKDTAPTAGKASHIPILYSAGAGGSRLVLATRSASSNIFLAGARRLDADAFASASVASDGNYHVLAAHGDYSNGFVRLMVDGVVVGSAALPSGAGSTSNTTSSTAAMSPAANELPGHLTAICVINAATSATDLSRIQRFIALLGGTEAPNIPLV